MHKTKLLYGGRIRSLPIDLLCLVCLALGLIGCTQDSEPEISSATATPLPTAVPTAETLGRTELPIGVQIFEDDVTTPALEHLRGAGVSWARTRALWKLIEREQHSPSQYDWSTTDWLFGDATTAGFRNVAVVYANPTWVSERECMAVPEDLLERYADFWTALVERYDGDGIDDAPQPAEVHYWQISNEPDYDIYSLSDESDYGGCFGHDPESYADQLVVAAKAIRKADADAQIGFGPIAWDRFTVDSAPTGWTSPPGPFVYDFTSRALEHLHREYTGEAGFPFIDFIGLHNYNDNAHFWDGPQLPLGREMLGRLESFRAEQLTLPRVFDLRQMPILISETGFASAPSDEWTERSEDLQAVYVGQTMVRAMAANVIAAIWYTARDNIMGDCAPPHYDWLSFGLMRSDDYFDALSERCPKHEWMDMASYEPHSPAEPKPALIALSTLTSALRSYSFERQLDATSLQSTEIEAFLFRGPAKASTLVAWANKGDRLGKIGADQATATLAIDAGLITPWTGRVEILDHLGVSTFRDAEGGAAIDILLNAAPVYIRSAPKE